MPSNAYFDNQEAVDELQAAGIPAQQAKAHAVLLAEALQEHDKAISARCCTREDLSAAVAPLATKAELAATVEPLATKAELVKAVAEAETRLVARTDATEARLTAEIKMSALSLKSELMKWWVTIGLGQAALIAAIVKLMD